MSARLLNEVRFYPVRDFDARGLETGTISCVKKSTLSAAACRPASSIEVKSHPAAAIFTRGERAREGEMANCNSLTDLEFVGQRLVVDDVGRPLGRDHLLHHVRVDGAAVTPGLPRGRGRARLRRGGRGVVQVHQYS